MGRPELLTLLVVTIVGCAADDGPPPAIDAPNVGAADAGPDAAIGGCTLEELDGTVEAYCAGAYMNTQGQACSPSTAMCESDGARQRDIAMAAGCLCYLCDLYEAAIQQQTCATRDLEPGFLLEQCLGGALPCP